MEDAFSMRIFVVGRSDRTDENELDEEGEKKEEEGWVCV